MLPGQFPSNLIFALVLVAEIKCAEENGK